MCFFFLLVEMVVPVVVVVMLTKILYCHLFGGWTDGRTGGWADGWMDGWLVGWMDGGRWLVGLWIMDGGRWLVGWIGDDSTINDGCKSTTPHLHPHRPSTPIHPSTPAPLPILTRPPSTPRIMRA